MESSVASEFASCEVVLAVCINCATIVQQTPFGVNNCQARSICHLSALRADVFAYTYWLSSCLR
jgi:hypothetical protein